MPSICFLDEDSQHVMSRVISFSISNNFIIARARHIFLAHVELSCLAFVSVVGQKTTTANRARGRAELSSAEPDRVALHEK